MDEGAQADGQFPARVDRDYEERLLDLCASRPLDLKQWDAAGPRFFMAGLAVMVACVARRQNSELQTGRTCWPWPRSSVPEPATWMCSNAGWITARFVPRGLCRGSRCV